MVSAADVLLGRANPLSLPPQVNTQFPPNTIPGPQSQDPAAPPPAPRTLSPRAQQILDQFRMHFGHTAPQPPQQSPAALARAAAIRADIQRNVLANAAAGIGPVNQPNGWLPGVGGSLGMANSGFAGFDATGAQIQPWQQYDASWTPLARPKPLGFVGAFPGAGGFYTDAQGNVGPRPAPPSAQVGPTAPNILGNTDQNYRDPAAVARDKANGGTGGGAPTVVDIARNNGGDTPAARAALNDPYRSGNNGVSHATGTGGLLSSALQTIARRRPALYGAITSAIGPTMAGSATSATSPSPTTSPTTSSTAPAPSTIPGMQVNGTTTNSASLPNLTQNAQTVLDSRLNTPVPGINLYGTPVQMGQVAPSVVQSTLLGYQDKYGVPVQDLQAEIQRYALASGQARQGY